MNTNFRIRDRRRRTMLDSWRMMNCHCHYLLLISLVVVFVGVKGLNDDEDMKIEQLNLEPSSVLLFHASKERRRKLSHHDVYSLFHNHTNSNSTNSSHNKWKNLYTGFTELPEDGGHVDEDTLELIQQHNLRIQEWEEQRQYSRYEHDLRRRRRRLQQGEEEQPQDQQWVPLSQGYGTHYATVWVGSPTPQRKSVIVDTGSHYTAFPCKGCVGCGEEYHTDLYFDYEASKTFVPLGCDECSNGAKCTDNRCILTQSYTEGSSWTAFQAQDVFFCGGTNVLDAADPNDRRFATEFQFGCQMHETGLFVTQLADGIMGLSAHDATFPQQLYRKNKLSHNMFSLCFRQEMTVSKKGITAGVMTLGGYDASIHTQPIRYAKNVAARTGGWYTIYVKNVFLRTNNNADQVLMKIPIQRSVLNSGKGIIVDSGTTDTYLHESIKSVFSHAWKEVTGTPYSNSPIRLTTLELERLPTILLQIRADPNSPSPIEEGDLIHKLDPTSPQDIVLAIPAIHYMEYSPSKDLFTSRLYFTETKGGVLGANAMQGHDVVFDYENARIGFAPSNCKKTFPTAEQTPTVTSGVEHIPGSVVSHSLDCQLSSPSLVTSCLDYIRSDYSDIEQTCSSNPSLVLKGKETWSSLIYGFAKPGGQSCEKVLSTDTNEEEVNCDASVGVCWKRTECEIPCQSNLWRNPVFAANNCNVEATKEEWSICTHDCQQSRFMTNNNMDNNCHTEQRICHVDECATRHPCKVPFIVHAIFELRGVHPYQFTSTSKQTFVQSFCSSLGQNFTLSEGDVKVLTPLPLFLNNQGQEDDNNDVAGVKLVLEVSITNTQSDNSCKEIDLYPLARIAHDMHVELERESFVERLLTSAVGSDQFFQPLSPVHIKTSHMVASWTIKTNVDGGKVHDHALDPYLGKLDYIFVISYYVSTIPSIVSIIISLFIVYIYLTKGYTQKNQHDDKHINGNNNPNQHKNSKQYSKRFHINCPNPLNLAHKKFMRSYHHMKGMMYPEKQEKISKKTDKKSLILNEGGGLLHAYDDDDASTASESSSIVPTIKLSKSSKTFYDLESSHNMKKLEKKRTIRKKEMMQYRSKLNSIILN